MTKRTIQDEEPVLLLPSEVAELLRITVRTVSRMADRGDIEVIVLPSGHRRYLRADIERIINGASAWTAPTPLTTEKS